MYRTADTASVAVKVETGVFRFRSVWPSHLTTAPNEICQASSHGEACYSDSSSEVPVTASRSAAWLHPSAPALSSVGLSVGLSVELSVVLPS